MNTSTEQVFPPSSSLLVLTSAQSHGAQTVNSTSTIPVLIEDIRRQTSDRLPDAHDKSRPIDPVSDEADDGDRDAPASDHEDEDQESQVENYNDSACFTDDSSSPRIVPFQSALFFMVRY